MRGLTLYNLTCLRSGCYQYSAGVLSCFVLHSFVVQSLAVPFQVIALGSHFLVKVFLDAQFYYDIVHYAGNSEHSDSKIDKIDR